jgi:hypothetical protein
VRARSLKMQRRYAARRRLVAALLDERPVCERCHSARAVDVHEVLSRARGGSILDEANCRTLCRACHDWITLNPAAAEAEGWSRSQFNGGRVWSETVGPLLLVAVMLGLPVLALWSVRGSAS